MAQQIEENKDKAIHLDEKIDALIEWNKKYPRVEVGKISSTKYLRQYASSEEEYENLKKGYKQVREYYNYIRNIRNQRGLSTERFEKLRNGNIRGVFGESDLTLGLARKYRIRPDKINYLISKYRSIEEFLKVNREGNIDEEDISYLRDNITDIIDISNTKNPGFNMLYRLIEQRENIEPMNRTLQLVDFEELKEYLRVCLTQRELEVIINVFGLEDGKCRTLSEIGKEGNCTRQSILEIKTRAIEKLRQTMVAKKISKFGRYCLDEDKRKLIEDIVYNSNAIFIPDEEFKDEPYDISTHKYRKIIGKETVNMPESISSIQLSVRSHNALMRAGIDTIQKLIEASDSMISNIRNLGPKGCEEIFSKKDELKNRYGEKRKENKTPIDVLNMKGAIYNILMRLGIDTVEKLVKLDEKTLLNYKNIGPKKLKDILEIKETGILFLENDKLNTYTTNNVTNECQIEENGKTELESLKERKERLLGEKYQIEQQLGEAKDLLVSYEGMHDGLVGKDNPNFDENR